MWYVFNASLLSVQIAGHDSSIDVNDVPFTSP